MTAEYLTNSENYQKDLFFKKNFIGASFAQGAFQLRNDSSGRCLVLVNGVPTPNYVCALVAFFGTSLDCRCPFQVFNLTAGMRYGFLLSDPYARFGISTSSNVRAQLRSS